MKSGWSKFVLCLSLLYATRPLVQAQQVIPTTQSGIVYGEADGQQLTMDYYAPQGPGKHPIAIVIHGGGYIGGTSRNGSEGYTANFLAPAGYAVFAINYRLALRACSRSKDCSILRRCVRASIRVM
jgi:acetyl esterase/lipase